MLALPALAEQKPATPMEATPAGEATAAAEASPHGEVAPTTESASLEEVPSAPESASLDQVPPAPEPALAEIEPVLEPLSADALARRTFATDVVQREPVDSISSLGNDHDRVYYFTELVGVEGREVTHRWEFRGEVVAEVPIAVGGPRWRAYSSKTLDASWLGEWTVSVVDDSGHVLQTDSFVFEQAAPEPEVAATTTASEPEVAATTTAPDDTPTAATSTPMQPPAAPAPETSTPDRGATAVPTE